MGANNLNLRGFANNFDMPALFMTDEDAWPQTEEPWDEEEQGGEEIPVWHHSDFKEVPYQHVRKLYEKFVELMNN